MAIYRDRLQLDREFPPPQMLRLIRQKVGQDEDMCLAAISVFASSGNEAEEMVDLGLVTQPQYNSLLRYRDDCRARAAEVASPPHFHFTWMSPKYDWFNEDLEHDCNKGGNIFIANVQGRSMMRFWWRDYIYEARRQLEKRPWGTTVTGGDFFDQTLKDGSKCRLCKRNLEHDFRNFTGIFARKIEDAVSQARYHSCFSDVLLTPIFGIGCIRELIKMYIQAASLIIKVSNSYSESTPSHHQIHHHRCQASYQQSFIEDEQKSACCLRKLTIVPP